MSLDFRSDTFTLPTQEMREAMFNSELGDDVFCEDPTVNRLEDLAAEVTGKERALFVSSGTMGNLIALMTHCNRGEEVFLGDQSHIFYYEQGGISSIAGLIPRTLKNQSDGTISIDDFYYAVRTPDIHYPKTGLICLENTHNRCNGMPLELDYHKIVSDFAKEQNLKIHLDGARLFNAAHAINKPVNEILEFVDTAMLCLSKGLASPVGSILVGTSDFIEKARRIRKLLGGGMRQAGVLAACGVVSLEKISKLLKYDNERAYRLAEELNRIDGLNVDMERVRTNIFYMNIDEKHGDAKSFCEKLSDRGVHILDIGKQKVRFVTHYMISDKDINCAIDAVKEIIE